MSSDSDALIGLTIAHYRILAVLGEGGMGVVYKARDTKLGRYVALKVLPAPVAMIPESRQRFEREVKAIAAVNHPNIVTIHTVEESAGHLFYTMEFVDGPLLGDLIRRQGLPLKRFFEIALALTDAMDCAHSEGITHRDLKPNNVVIDAEGRIKVLDFGLAKLKTLATDNQEQTVVLDSGLTTEGKIVGTVAYMSPEQAEGKVIDHRSDIFSLGIILYEMATAKRPFVGDTPVSTVSSIIKDTPASITELNREVPHHLGRIVRRCLAKDPNRRYQTARDLHNDLLDLREEIDSGEMDRPDYREPAGRGRLRPWQLVALSVFIVAVVMVAVNRFLPMLQYRNQAVLEVVGAMEVTPLTRSGDITQASLSPDGKYLAYIRTDGRRRSLRLRQIATGSDQEVIAPGEAPIADPRISPGGDFIYYHVAEGDGAIYRIPLLGGRARRIVSDADARFDLSPDGQTVVFNRWSNLDRHVMVADVDGTESRNLVTYSVMTSHEVAVSPDGKEVATSQQSPGGLGEIVVAVPLAGGDERKVCDETWNAVSGFAWLPDGGMLIAGSRGPTRYHDPIQIWLQDDKGREPVSLTHDLNSYGSLSLAQDGQLLAAVQTQSRIAVCMAPLADPDRVQEVSRISNAGHFWDQVSWTPDGRILHQRPHGESLHIWEADPDGGDQQRITTAGNLNMAAEVSRDGNHIVYFSNRSGSNRIWISDRDGGNPRLLAEGGHDELWPQFTPDGRNVLYITFNPADNRFTWRTVPVAGGPSSMLSDIVAYDWAFSADGERLAVVGPDSQTDSMVLRFMSADLTETYASYECGFRWPSILRWLPDGSGVAFTVPTDDSRNIWVQPAEGGAPWQLTHRRGGTVMGFDFNPAGDTIGYSWLEDTSDAVLLKNFKGAGRP